MLEKAYTTFKASNTLLKQQYRELHFTKYSLLIACLLVAEKNNELLLKKTTNLALPNLYHYLKPMPQLKLIDVGVGMGVGMGVDIFMDEIEVVVVVAIFLGIKVIIINLTIRKTTPITKS